MQRMWFRHNSGNLRAVFGAKPWKSKHTLQQKLRKFDKNFKIMSAEPSRHPNKTCSQTLPKKYRAIKLIHAPCIVFDRNYPPWNEHNTYQEALPKGKLFSNHPFSCAMPVSGRVSLKSMFLLLLTWRLLKRLTGHPWLKLKKDIAEPKNISRRSQLKHICTAT